MKDLRFFLGLFRPYLGWLLAGGFLAVVTSMASIALLGLSGWFICAAAVAGSLAADGVAAGFNFMQPAAQIRALAIIRTLGRYAERLLTHEATFRVLAEIRQWFFKQLSRLSPAQLASLHSGDVLNRITQDIDALDAIYIRILVPASVVLTTSLAVATIVYLQSPVLAVILLMVVFITAVLVPVLFNHLGSAVAEKEVQLNSQYKTTLIDLLQGLEDILTLTAYPVFKKRLSDRLQQILTVQKTINRLSALIAALVFLLANLLLVLLLMMGSRFIDQSYQAPVLAMLVFLVMALFEGMTPMAQAIQMLGKTKKAAHRVRTVAQTQPLVMEPAYPESLPENNIIELNKLGFHYPGASQWVLKDIDLSIPEGNKLAFVGASGAGKTTLLMLILRYFDPQQGSITLGGKDYQQLTTDSLMSRFAMLSQKTHLFVGSIRDNLLIARPQATETELMQAIELAGLSRWVLALTDGLDTWVGEQGAQVSGGEARRIALARLYLKDAPVILLDEPTEGLDRETEKQVLDALKIITQDKTLIMVTHRKTGLELVDRVYKISHGKLYETGKGI